MKQALCVNKSEQDQSSTLSYTLSTIRCRHARRSSSRFIQYIMPLLQTRFRNLPFLDFRTGFPEAQNSRSGILLASTYTIEHHIFHCTLCGRAPYVREEIQKIDFYIKFGVHLLPNTKILLSFTGPLKWKTKTFTWAPYYVVCSVRGHWLTKDAWRGEGIKGR